MMLSSVIAMKRLMLLGVNINVAKLGASLDIQGRHVT